MAIKTYLKVLRFQTTGGLLDISYQKAYKWIKTAWKTTLSYNTYKSSD